jgi:hypothetical protein
LTLTDAAFPNAPMQAAAALLDPVTSLYKGQLTLSAAGSIVVGAAYERTALPGWPQTASVAAGSISAAHSVFSAFPAHITAGQSHKVTLEARDAHGNLVRFAL